MLSSRVLSWRLSCLSRPVLVTQISRQALPPGNRRCHCGNRLTSKTLLLRRTVDEAFRATSSCRPRRATNAEQVTSDNNQAITDPALGRLGLRKRRTPLSYVSRRGAVHRLRVAWTLAGCGDRRFLSAISLFNQAIPSLCCNPGTGKGSMDVLDRLEQGGIRHRDTAPGACHAPRVPVSPLARCGRVRATPYPRPLHRGDLTLIPELAPALSLIPRRCCGGVVLVSLLNSTATVLNMRPIVSDYGSDELT
jgi:hypothetical protein